MASALYGPPGSAAAGQHTQATSAGTGDSGYQQAQFAFAQVEGMRQDRDWLDAEFPLGDGTADTSTVVECPWCAQRFEISVDPGGAAVQRYVEDCQVCCRPLQLTVRWSQTGLVAVDARPEEDLE